jgi:hypothetical protein
MLVATASALAFTSHDSEEPAKFTVRIEAPASDVEAAVAQVSQDQIIHGTYSYDKERILYGAHSASAAQVFGTWKGAGKVFYKIANNVLSPRYFKDTNDIGTISVRYVVESADTKSTILQIDSVFIDARNQRHSSLGNVESSEYAAIQQRMRTLQEKQQAATESAAMKPHTVASPAPQVASSLMSESAPTSALEAATVPALQKHVSALRHEVELQVKSSGAQMKSAPYHNAATLESLAPESEVLIEILTQYWYGVETVDGHRGWIHHSQLEPLP